MQAGSLRADNALSELGTGVFVSNLWYLNYSDRASCRTTGMTRFATFWVEDGVFEAPLSVMRFDDTFYRMLGENLVGLTEERDFIFDSSTYEQRRCHQPQASGRIDRRFCVHSVDFSIRRS